MSRIATTISKSTNRKHRPNVGTSDHAGGSGRAYREDLEAMTLLFGEDSPDSRSEPVDGRKTVTRRTTSLILLALGLVLLVGPLLLVAVAGVLGLSLPLFLMMNMASVACIALGVLLLPERSLWR